MIYLKTIGLALIIYMCLFTFSNVPTYNKDNAGVFIAILSFSTAIIGSLTTYFVVSSTNKRTIKSQQDLQNNQLQQQKNELLYKVSYEKSHMLIELRKESINKIKEELAHFSLYSYKSLNLLNSFLFKKNLILNHSKEYLERNFHDNISDEAFKIQNDYIANNDNIVECISKIKIHEDYENTELKSIVKFIEQFHAENLDIWDLLFSDFDFCKKNNNLSQSKNYEKLFLIREDALSKGNQYTKSQMDSITNILNTIEQEVSKNLL